VEQTAKVKVKELSDSRLIPGRGTLLQKQDHVSPSMTRETKYDFKNRHQRCDPPGAIQMNLFVRPRTRL
jgi:hypothetical protein